MKLLKITLILFLSLSMYACTEEEETEIIQTEVEEKGPVKIKGDFAHVVYFWLKNPDSEVDNTAFTSSLEAFVQQNKFIRSYHLGKPAHTPREVVDNSYTYCLIVTFDSKEDQDAYQVADDHQALLKVAAPLWERVQIYDSL